MTARLAEICETVGDVTMMTNSVANNGNLFGATDYYLYKEEILETSIPPEGKAAREVNDGKYRLIQKNIATLRNG